MHDFLIAREYSNAWAQFSSNNHASVQGLALTTKALCITTKSVTNTTLCTQNRPQRITRENEHLTIKIARFLLAKVDEQCPNASHSWRLINMIDSVQSQQDCKHVRTPTQILPLNVTRS